ncbi:MAG: glycosyltransferase, partial [Candidatus Acidiferrum sp.]
PVLCNSLACEGIPMTHGEEIFVADGPENFASAAAYLLENESVRTGIAEKGYHLTLDKYSWNRLAAEFASCYFKILGSHENKRSSAPVSVENLL